MTSKSEAETIDIAADLAGRLRGDEVILLSGELGAGKTVFTKGICRGLGLEDIHSVGSPSYTLVNIYSARFTVYHMDLYRLGGDSDITDLGWEDFLGEGVIVIEWAEKITVDFPCIRVNIEAGEDENRTITIRDSVS
ncbi:MAG: tRNA (adenosine(37)-N6)-threonylcarbamoyltransferase complex ATPase subunit type 1 TsaE [Candidatus Aminicenantes bacterium]|nr:tRNA (adenosine(37)-N6)-threonylcarbamoyltransferase complex ATPase subunit type 1 TsaE [Candidatus Aminicenantes bacterium]